MKTPFINDKTYKKAILNVNRALGVDFELVLERIDEKDEHESTNNCPTVALCDLLAGELSSKEEEKVKHHLKTCPKCGKVLEFIESRNTRARTEFRRRVLPSLGSLLPGRSSKKKSNRILTAKSP